MRGVSTVGGDVVVLLGNKSDPEGVLRLAGGHPGDYTIDKSGKYAHLSSPIAMHTSRDTTMYRHRTSEWVYIDEDGAWVGVEPNNTHQSIWWKLRALRIVVE